jgi:hypothetical protein
LYVSSIAFVPAIQLFYEKRPPAASWSLRMPARWEPVWRCDLYSSPVAKPKLCPARLQSFHPHLRSQEVVRHALRLNRFTHNGKKSAVMLFNAIAAL